MLLVLLTRLLVWAALGLFIWWVLLKFIPPKFLTWFGGAVILTMIVLSFVDPNDDTIGTIWQAISLPLTPLGATITLLAVGLNEGAPKKRGQLVAFALTILLVSSIPLVARALVGQAEQAVQRAYTNQRQLCVGICPAVGDVPLDRVVSVVVLGEPVDRRGSLAFFPSQIDADNDLDPVLVSRLDSAAATYNQLVAEGAGPLLLTVTAGPTNADSDEGRQTRRALVSQLASQIPSIPNTLDGAAVNGRINVTASGMDLRRAALDQQTFLRERGLIPTEGPVDDTRDARRIMLVAPALSMRRAALTFEELGLQVVAWPTEIYGTDLPNPRDTLVRLADLVPNADALRLTTRYWEELLASFYYFLRGWLPGFNVQWENVVEVYDR